MIKKESRDYFKALGAYVALLRKARGMTQAELARAIGVSQQAVFAYELGERRVSVLILKRVAAAFDVPVQDLVNFSGRRDRRGEKKTKRLAPRVVHHARRLNGLRKTQQRFIFQMIDLMDEHNQRLA